MFIRIVEESDIEGVIFLFRRTFGKGLSADYYRWKYGHQGGFSSVCAVNQDGLIVGHVGLSIKRYMLNGSSVFGASRHTSMVDEEYRGDGIYTAMLEYSRSFLIRNNVSFLFGWPNVHNMKASLMDERFVPLFQIPMLTLGEWRQESERVTVNYRNASSLSCFNDCVENPYDDSFILNKDKRYFNSRYIEHPDVDYLVADFPDYDFSIFLNKNVEQKTLYLMDVMFCSNDNVSAMSLIKYILVDEQFSGYSLNLIYNINCRRQYVQLLRSGFMIGSPVFNLGVYYLDDSLSVSEYINSYRFSLGDLDVL